MLVIPAGSFYRGCNDSDCDADELPADPTLKLSVFAIDRLEVTAGAYQLCVDAGGCTDADSSFPECNGSRPSYADHPINCVTWLQADTYCAWADKRLPTEAEWEKAARGEDGRRYPWGSSNPSCSLAVIVTNGYGCGTGETWPVGSKPAGVSPNGLLNVGGNVHEWVADWYGTFEVAVDDPKGPPSGTQRVSRGASLRNGSNGGIRVGNRHRQDPDHVAFELGFRCAAG